jgi:beta-lactamase class A
MPRGPLATLQLRLSAASMRAPGNVAIEVKDLATGLSTSINAGANMPAASTIKIPVMVEVFRQMEQGKFDLNTVLHVEPRDRDWGWGDLVSAPIGTPRSVTQLLWLMITDSDNTATNMLIRLVGRTHINATMTRLGLHATHLGDLIRSDGDIRSLRSSPNDMVKLLEGIAREQLVDEWSSRAMATILTGQHHNGLIPEPLPPGLRIAHKTGTLHDTLNDVGIVYLHDEPYVVAVMTTHLPSLGRGRTFIRHVSRLAFDSLARFELWRERFGLPAFAPDPAVSAGPLPPDLQMWNAAPANSAIDPNAPSAPNTSDATLPSAPLQATPAPDSNASPEPI